MISDNSKKTWKEFYNNILRKPVYWVSIIFIFLLSYLFDLSNRTIGTDDLVRPIFFGKDHYVLSGTRWGKTLWIYICSNIEFVPFIDKYLSLVFFVISAVLFSRILYIYINQNNKLFLCTLFSCLYISYPLVNEIWNYNDPNAMVTGNSVLVAMCILLLYNRKKIISKETLICSILLSIVVSSYESSAFLYVTVVVSVILMDSIFFREKRWFIRGCYFAFPLIIAFILRYVIGFGLIRLLHLKYNVLGDSGIYWTMNKNILVQVQELLFDIFINYGLKALIYMPIAIFILSFVTATICIIIFSIKRKQILSFLLYLLLIISLFLLSIIQGKVMPYRTAQTLQYFCPFALTMSVFAFSLLKKRSLLMIYCGFLSFICYRQGVFLNKTLALNNQRSDNEAAIAYDLGIKLQEFDTSKPVYFVGDVSLGDFINRQIRPDPTTMGGYLYKKFAVENGLSGKIYNYTKLYETNVNSVIHWSRREIGWHTMKRYLSYYGFDLSSSDYLNWDDYDYYLHQAIDNNMKPLSVQDMGGYILVYLGPDIYIKNP